MQKYSQIASMPNTDPSPLDTQTENVRPPKPDKYLLLIP